MMYFHIMMSRTTTSETYVSVVSIIIGRRT